MKQENQIPATVGKLNNNHKLKPNVLGDLKNDDSF